MQKLNAKKCCLQLIYWDLTDIFVMFCQCKTATNSCRSEWSERLVETIAIRKKLILYTWHSHKRCPCVVKVDADKIGYLRLLPCSLFCCLLPCSKKLWFIFYTGKANIPFYLFHNWKSFDLVLKGHVILPAKERSKCSSQHLREIRPSLIFLNFYWFVWVAATFVIVFNVKIRFVLQFKFSNHTM